MRRDEAFAKATEAVSAFSVARKEAWDEHLGSRPSPPADWLHPTVHQLIAALEAIGVVKFDPESACPFGVGDLVRSIYGDLMQTVVVIEETREGGWLITTNKSTTKWHVHELELVAQPGRKIAKAGRKVHMVPIRSVDSLGQSATVDEDTLVETLRMIGYDVVLKENPPKAPEAEYMICGCTQGDFCPQGGAGPRQRCKIPISKKKRWVLERALRMLNGEN